MCPLLEADFELDTQREKVDQALAQHVFSVGILKGNTLTPKKNVVILPYTVETLVENHVSVMVERGLGSGAEFIDLDYADSGAEIEDEQGQVIRKADILVCLRPLSPGELLKLRDDRMVILPMSTGEISAAQLAVMHEKKITALSLRLVKNVVGEELLQDILGAQGGNLRASAALGDLVLSLIFPLLFARNLREAVRMYPSLLNAIYCYKGILTRQEIAERLHLPWSDLLQLCWDWN